MPRSLPSVTNRSIHLLFPSGFVGFISGTINPLTFCETAQYQWVLLCGYQSQTDDYLEKCWKGLRKSDVFRYEIYGYNSDHEKLFDYLGITDQAKQAYNDYKAGKFRNKSDKKTSEKKIISEKNLTNGIFSIVIDN